MKIIATVIILLLIACQIKAERKDNTNYRNSVGNDILTKDKDTLYVLEKTNDENYLIITAPENSGLELPDSSGKVDLIKSGDFNADKKIDKMVNLGACGTGGCMTGVFLNHHDNYYTLAFKDYLKNPEFETDKKGLWNIISSEEIEPYNPSKRQISVFKLDKKKKYYVLDKTFVHQDKMK